MDGKLDPEWLALWTPISRWGELGIALGVEDHGQQLRSGDAIDHAVVHLCDQPPSALAEPLDEPHLPQGPVTVELLGHHACDQLA